MEGSSNDPGSGASEEPTAEEPAATRRRDRWQLIASCIGFGVPLVASVLAFAFGWFPR